MIKVLLIDELSFTDDMLLKIIEGVQSQSEIQSASHAQNQKQATNKFCSNANGCLEEIILMGVELSSKTVDFLTSEVFMKQKRLNQLVLSNLGRQMVNQEHYERLFEALASGPRRGCTELKRLKFTRMNIH